VQPLLRRTKAGLPMPESRSETAISRSISSGLESLGAIAIRVQSGLVKVRGGWMHLAPPGTPDRLFLLENGCGLWLETKTPIGSLSTEQIAWHYEARKRGHNVFTVKSEREARAAWEEVRG
jgi:hypothetical protein